MSHPDGAREGADDQASDPEQVPDRSSDEKARHVEDTAALTPVIEQQGGAALANIGGRRSSDLFPPD